MKRAVRTRPALAPVLAIVLLATGCGAIRSHRQLEEPLGAQLTSGIGGTLFRLNKTGDLPNAFGGRDIWGGKVDKGFAEMKLVGIEDQTVVLDRHQPPVVGNDDGSLQTVSAKRGRQR